MLSKTNWSQVLIGVALLLATAGGIYRYQNLRVTLLATEENLATTTAALTAQVADLTAALQQSRAENADLASKFEAEKQRNDNFAGQVNNIASQVGTLEKLKNTDPELLKKYSKVYFLNENYLPKKISMIDPQYVWDSQDKTIGFQTDILPHLIDLLGAAKQAGQPLLVVSAYRSFGVQAALKTDYVVTYGAGTANKFSADQGYSEHQLGTTVDLTTPALGAKFEGVDKTTAYEWLTSNAYRFGFVMSYPDGNAYYQYEPWHWRYVGVALATRLHDGHKYFYDLDQREIDQYLVNFFD